MAPKPSIPSDENGPAGHKLVFHLIQPRSDLARFFHNKTMHPLHGVSVHYLFARFAQTIFQQIQGFLQGGLNRYVWSVEVKAGEARDIQPGWRSAADCAAKTTKYRPRTPSPTKKSKRPHGDVDAEEVLSIDRTERVSSTDSPPFKRLRSMSDSVSSSSSINTTLESASKRACSPSPKAVLPDPTQYRWNPPCTCPIPENPDNSLSDASNIKTVAPLSASPSSSKTSKHSRGYFLNNYKFCASNHCRNYLEARRVGRLKKTALSDERSRSGTEMSWAEHLAWAERKALGREGFNGEEEIERWAWIQGRDIVDGSGARD